MQHNSSLLQLQCKFDKGRRVSDEEIEEEKYYEQNNARLDFIQHIDARHHGKAKILSFQKSKHISNKYQISPSLQDANNGIIKKRCNVFITPVIFIGGGRRGLERSVVGEMRTSDIG